MASYNDWVANGGTKLDWAMPFQRTGGFPLDRTDMFSSLEDAVKYASGGDDSRGLSGSSYVGQIITVWEDSIVKAYQIQEDRSLKELGSGSEIATGHALYYDENGKLSVKMASKNDGDKSLPISAADVETTVGNIETLLSTI